VEEALPAQGGVAVEQPNQVAREHQQVLLGLLQVPVDPGQLVILTVGVVVAVLRSPELVAGRQHGHAVRDDNSG